MSDWDDFMFYESMREDNGGIPVAGDPFHDQDGYILVEAEKDREEWLEQIELEARGVLEFLVNEFIFYGFIDDWFLKLKFEKEDLVDCDVISSEEAAKTTDVVPLLEVVTDNGRGDMLPDFRKIQDALAKIHFGRLEKK